MFRQPPVASAQAHFTNTPKADVSRSKFDRSHALKTTFDADYLIPHYVDEVLPGDTFNLRETCFARLGTPLRPVMDNLYLDTFYFFVPSRLVWDNWQRFCGERTSPTDDPSALTVPQMQFLLEDIDSNHVLSYLGIPQGGTGTASVNALPYRAYQLIWNEWFRDQNLLDPLTVSTGNGPDALPAGTILPLLRGKRKDYFTSCLPWPQKGDPVLIPVGPIVGDGNAMQLKANTTGTPTNMRIEPSLNVKMAANPPGNEVAAYYGDVGLMVDNSAATINDLRAAFQIQKLLERDARGGTRYIELILAHFGVQSDDARLQRPEYLGGSHSRISISPVPATFHNTEVAQGELGGFGTAINRGGFNKSFTEHGYIIGMANVRADLTYQQGLERLWKRNTRYDYYWPALAHLGEQAVLNSEIMFTGTVSDLQVFGYQERYAEYRYKPSRITGKFHSADPSSLDVWHLGQDFPSVPQLNGPFINSQTPMARILAVPSEPHVLMDVWFDLKCDRAMPVYSVPGMVDHF